MVQKVGLACYGRRKEGTEIARSKKVVGCGHGVLRQAEEGDQKKRN
jgi:hypothetical protein